MNTAPRLRLIDILLIGLSTMAMLTALSRHASASEIQELGCPKGPKDDSLTFQRIMINFGRYTLSADSIARLDSDTVLKNQLEIEKSVSDLGLAIACTRAAIANKAILLPSTTEKFSSTAKEAYIHVYGEWLEKYLLALTDYQTAMSHLLLEVNSSLQSATTKAVDMTEVARLSRLASDIANESHRLLNTASWCESKLH